MHANTQLGADIPRRLILLTKGGWVYSNRVAFTIEGLVLRGFLGDPLS
jgi:hypothetical protein